MFSFSSSETKGDSATSVARKLRVSTETILSNMFPRRTGRRLLVSLVRLVRRYSCYATERLVMPFRRCFSVLFVFRQIEETRNKKKEKKERCDKNGWDKSNTNHSIYLCLSTFSKRRETFFVRHKINGSFVICYTTRYASHLWTFLRSWRTIGIEIKVHLFIRNVLSRNHRDSISLKYNFCIILPCFQDGFIKSKLCIIYRAFFCIHIDTGKYICINRIAVANY